MGWRWPNPPSSFDLSGFLTNEEGPRRAPRKRLAGGRKRPPFGRLLAARGRRRRRHRRHAIDGVLVEDGYPRWRAALTARNVAAGGVLLLGGRLVGGGIRLHGATGGEQGRSQQGKDHVLFHVGRSVRLKGAVILAAILVHGPPKLRAQCAPARAIGTMRRGLPSVTVCNRAHLR